MANIAEIDTSRLPRHVAVIMDGNGRWATSRGLDRSAGHVEGVKTVRRITEAASETGIEYLTLYTFSTENWNRPKAEVDALMHLIVIAIERETPDLIKNNVRLRMIGDVNRLPAEARERLDRCIADTAACTGLTLTLALSYSSRWEILEACRRFATDVKEGRKSPESMAADADFEQYLTTASMPDPDLLIRTGGDHRVSNYLLWQIAYAEIYVTDTFWPDFSREDFFTAIANYQNRERRFGLTSAQIK
ncbi:isoprenyl transferase [Duncaniella freteri]|jgi:undecaprenyl diphosphate synthase|uniref:isoprenyl transferase n=1 Tax=Duncaniella freteri TaxID=2530391 RepID=UPI00136DF311|nr:isoprenyl transferase [Duncaniella freteri]NBJ08498.1 isoprenyl transferase [Alistipes sp. Z76]NCE70504.1 isoprenyl transferase [Muribaculaceae bacterium M3]